MRASQPTPEFLPGEPHGQRSLAGYGPWGCKRSDMTEVIEDAHMQSVRCSLLRMEGLTHVTCPSDCPAMSPGLSFPFSLWPLFLHSSRPGPLASHQFVGPETFQKCSIYFRFVSVVYNLILPQKLSPGLGSVKQCKYKFLLIAFLRSQYNFHPTYVMNNGYLNLFQSLSL